ncbi:MAG: TetR family transcriptional regulator [Flavipsychrobacter sp.]|nr:TetR family transcriptional regulator [Flavipsychrobacter sp.]
MKAKETIEKNQSTEELIKNAARRVFTKKGYAATRTRDIAEESGFNLALINYYFRSKEKLFDIIMLEHIQTFVYSIMGIVNDRNTTLQEKLQILISHYIDMLIENPNLPMFVLNEVNADPQKLVDKLGIDKSIQEMPYMLIQWKEMAAKTKMPAFNPVHMLMNIVSLTIFPFIGSPMIRNRTGIDVAAFNILMEERKKLIPIWIKAIMMSGHAEE